MDCIPQDKDRDQWRAVLNTAANPGLPTKARDPSISYPTTAFPRSLQVFGYWTTLLTFSLSVLLSQIVASNSNISNKVNSLHKANSQLTCQGIPTLACQLNIHSGNWTRFLTKSFYSATVKQHSPYETHINHDFNEYMRHATYFWQRPRLQYRKKNTARHISYSRLLS